MDEKKKNESGSLSKQEDIAWIDQALEGDQGAYNRLMKKYYPHIHNLIYRMIFKKEDVEDLTQEAFIKAFNSLHNFDRQFAFSTWLYKIATNNSIDYLRKKKLQTFSIDKEIESDESDYKFEIPDSDYIPDNRIIGEQRTIIIDKAIESLPEKYKRVIVMRHKEELEYEEIAKQLKLPLGTVKAHIFRGRELLNKFLKDRISNY